MKAVCVLHNYILRNCNKDGQYLNHSTLQRDNEEGGVTPGAWQQDGPSNNLQQIGHVAGNRSGTREARDQRDRMAEMFLTDGLAPWQFKYTFRTA